MSNPQTGVQSVFNMVLPNAPSIVPQSIDLRTLTEIDVDLSQLVDNGTIDFISGAYIDNSASAVSLSIRVSGSNQVVVFAAGEQGYIPLLAPNQPKFFITTPTVAGVIVPIIFHNIPLLPIKWNSAGQVVTVVNDTWLTDTELRASPVPVSLSATAPTYTDYTLTLNGGNQTLIAAGLADNYAIIQNPAGNANVTINIAGGTPTSGIVIAGGGSYEMPKGAANAVTVTGTNTQTLICFAG